MLRTIRTLQAVALICCAFTFAVNGIRTAQAEDDAKSESVDDRAMIKSNAKSYVAAFNGRDAKALAAHWSPEGVYISRQTGEQTIGRDALEKEFTAMFEKVKDAKLSVAVTSIEFVSPNVAVEQSSAVVARSNAPPEKTNYSAVHVKRDGKWLIDRISEESEPQPPPSHYKQLKQLDWMVGTWIDQDGGDVIKTTCQWTRNDNYLLRTFTASVGDRVDLAGMQFVGWDAARKQIRSWVFDSDGGFAEGTWAKQDDRWRINTTATLPDGRRASSTTIIVPIDDDRFSWQQVNRIVDGEILPNIEPIVIVRQ